MTTKLETLKAVLEVSGAEKETINDLILNYYNDAYSDCFETLDGRYYVYDVNDIKDELHTIADERYEELEFELKSLIRGGSYDLNVLIDEIDRDSAIKSLEDDLDYLTLEEYNKIFVIEEGDYFIFKEV